VEIMVVIAIIGVLTGVVVISASAARENAKIKSEMANVGQMELDMKLYREQHRVLPPGSDGVAEDNCSICRYADGDYQDAQAVWEELVAMFDAYTSVAVTEDAWGNPYGYDSNYRVNNQDMYSVLCSAGPDGVMQTYAGDNRNDDYDLSVRNPEAKGDDICVFFY